MKRALLYLLAILLGIAIGTGSALWLSGLLPGERRTGGEIDVDGWRGDFTQGSADASPYFRARIARHGLLALARSEAVYLTRARDVEGELLREECSYLMAGGAMPAEWWSVTLYDSENFLPLNDDDALSFDATRAGGGRWEVIIAPENPRGDGPWISSRNAGQFDLTLRMYVPDKAAVETPETTLDAPTISRITCAGDAT